MDRSAALVILATVVLASLYVLYVVIHAGTARDRLPAMTAPSPDRPSWEHPMCCGQPMRHVDRPWITDRLQCSRCGQTCTCLADEHV